MRILIDMNLTPRWVSHFTAAGHNAIHWSAVGAPTAKDLEICEYARINGFVLLTNDMDFPQILANTREAGPSVVLLRGEPLVPEKRAAALLLAIQACTEELSKGAILTFDWMDRLRVRLLPLK